ncbi:MAG: hypothetical protein LIO60_05255 [Oscillospiraceae bacterium]|nr:hypothetical protein [Oscillospiraceae bacterium]
MKAITFIKTAPSFHMGGQMAADFFGNAAFAEARRYRTAIIRPYRTIRQAWIVPNFGRQHLFYFARFGNTGGLLKIEDFLIAV